MQWKFISRQQRSRINGMYHFRVLICKTEDDFPWLEWSYECVPIFCEETKSLQIKKVLYLMFIHGSCTRQCIWYLESYQRALDEHSFNDWCSPFLFVSIWKGSCKCLGSFICVFSDTESHSRALHNVRRDPRQILSLDVRVNACHSQWLTLRLTRFQDLFSQIQVQVSICFNKFKHAILYCSIFQAIPLCNGKISGICWSIASKYVVSVYIHAPKTSCGRSSFRAASHGKGKLKNACEKKPIKDASSSDSEIHLMLLRSMIFKTLSIVYQNKRASVSFQYHRLYSRAIVLWKTNRTLHV